MGSVIQMGRSYSIADVPQDKLAWLDRSYEEFKEEFGSMSTGLTHAICAATQQPPRLLLGMTIRELMDAERSGYPAGSRDAPTTWVERWACRWLCNDWWGEHDELISGV